MGNEMQIYGFEGRDVRTVMMNGEPWFVLKDVCEVLGLTNSRMVAERIDEDDVSQTYIIDSLGRSQDTTIINESGLYSVILRSDKPEAKTFKRWVTSEVLPSIRRKGMYATDVTIDKMIADPDFAISLLTSLKEEKDKRIEAEAAKERAEGTVRLLIHSGKTYTATEIAKEVGLHSASELNQILKTKGIQFKSFNTGAWVPTTKYANMGLYEIKTTVRDGKTFYNSHFTQIGREFVLKMFSDAIRIAS